MHASIMIMSVCTVKLPVGHAVLHGFLKVSVELKEVRCTQHSAIPLRQKRNLSTLCSHSTLVTQASSRRCTNTQSLENSLPNMRQRSDRGNQVIWNAGVFVSLFFWSRTLSEIFYQNSDFHAAVNGVIMHTHCPIHFKRNCKVAMAQKFTLGKQFDHIYY